MLDNKTNSLISNGMEELKSHFEKEELHHAYLLEGDREAIKGIVTSLIEEAGFVVRGNPDIYSRHFESLTIDESRALKEASANKPIAGRKFIIISLYSIVLEAQNSLLKLFEEPTPNTHFFIIIPNASIFIPTLRSRFHLLSSRKKLPDDTGIDVIKFKKAQISKRLKMIEDIVESKDKERAVGFLDALEAHVSASEGAGKAAFLLEEVIKAKRELRGRSPGVKMLLEHISCIL